jgi:hypothetical protein
VIGRETVVEFCPRHDIGVAVDTCVQLALKHFTTAIQIDVFFGCDTDCKDEGVVVQALVRCTVEQASDAYDRLLEEWIGESDREARAKVRFVYRIG